MLARVQHDDHRAPDADLLDQGRLLQDGEEGVPAAEGERVHPGANPDSGQRPEGDALW